MKKFIFVTAIGLATTLSYAAKAEDNTNLYVSGKVGLTVPNDSEWSLSPDTGEIGFDNGINFAGALGLKLGQNIRTELEISYRKTDLSDLTVDGLGSASLGGDVKTWGGLINAYYDFMPESTISPYISGGIGLMHHKGSVDSVGSLSFSEVTGSDTVFAYQVGLGASFDVSEKIALDGGYRFLGTSDADFDGLDTEYGSHEFRVGARYSF